MAFTYNHYGRSDVTIGSTGSGSDTLSVTYAAGDLLLASCTIAFEAPGFTTPNGISGLGVTWTTVYSVAHASRRYFDLWRGVPSSGGTNNITFSWDGQAITAQDATFSCLRISGVDTTTNQGIVQSKTFQSNNTNSAGTALTLDSAVGSGNDTVAFGIGEDAKDLLDVQGWTEIGQLGSSNGRRHSAFYDTTGGATHQLDWSGGPQGIVHAVLEIDEDTGGGPTFLPRASFIM